MSDIFAYVRRDEVSLDFVNSKVFGGNTEPDGDLFSDYYRILQWCRHLEILTNDDVERLSQIANSRPEDKQTAFENIVRLRDANYRILSAVAHKQPPVKADTEILNQVLTEALPHLKLIPTDERFTWEWEKDLDSMEWMVWSIARSTAELLTSNQVQRIRQCDGCYWMFMDTSRNGLRRWCDMKTCGNRAKARRHYERVKKSNK